MTTPITQQDLDWWRRMGLPVTNWQEIANITDEQAQAIRDEATDFVADICAHLPCNVPVTQPSGPAIIKCLNCRVVTTIDGSCRCSRPWINGTPSREFRQGRGVGDSA